MRGGFEAEAGVEVGAFLRRLRRSLGWTLEDVVERVAREGVEITTSTLSRAERGIASLSPGRWWRCSIRSVRLWSRSRT